MNTGIHADHYHALLDCGGYVFDVPATIGKKEEKNPERRARNKAFNHDLAKAWLNKILDGTSIYAVPLQHKKIRRKNEQEV